MANTYFLNAGESPVSFEVKVGTTVAAGTVVNRLLPGDGGIVDIATSEPAASGNIPVTPLGTSMLLIASSLIVTTLLKAGKADDLDQVFRHLFMSVTLRGGPDGDRTFPLADGDKREYPGTRSIEALIVVRFQKK